MQDLGPGSTLADRTAERVVAFWRDWVTRPAPDAVSLVAIGGHRLMSAPTRLRQRLEGIPSQLTRWSRPSAMTSRNR